MSGFTGLVDTSIADKLSLRVDLVRLQSVFVPGPGPALAVKAASNDVCMPSGAARERQLFAGSPPAVLRADVVPALQALSAAGLAISTVLADLPSAAGPAVGITPLLPSPVAAAPHALAQSLAAAVSTSGLFYESHVAAFAAGLLDRFELNREPQARWAGNPGPQGADATSPDVSMNPAVRNQVAGTPAGHFGADLAVVIHPQARVMVAQQLELLAGGVFHWRGEAWPGLAMEWSIQQDEPAASDCRAAPEHERRWSTTLSLEMPNLGHVDVRLSLAGMSLHAAMWAEDPALVRFRAGEAELQQQLATAGFDVALAITSRKMP
jgi:hypothetical protein